MQHHAHDKVQQHSLGFPIHGLLTAPSFTMLPTFRIGAEYIPYSQNKARSPKQAHETTNSAPGTTTRRMKRDRQPRFHAL